jgi:uncharacterized protein DUF3558
MSSHRASSLALLAALFLVLPACGSGESGGSGSGESEHAATPTRAPSGTPHPTPSEATANTMAELTADPCSGLDADEAIDLAMDPDGMEQPAGEGRLCSWLADGGLVTLRPYPENDRTIPHLSAAHRLAGYSSVRVEGHRATQWLREEGCLVVVAVGGGGRGKSIEVQKIRHNSLPGPVACAAARALAATVIRHLQ